jgi:hypothetical protein
VNTSEGTTLTSRRLRGRDAAFMVVVICVAACAVQRPSVDPIAVARIRRGVTTQSDIRNWFGEPTGRSASGSGSTSWVYETGAGANDNVRLLGNVTSDLATIAGTKVPSSARSLSATATSGPPERLEVQFDASGAVTDFQYNQGGVASRASSRPYRQPSPSMRAGTEGDPEARRGIEHHRIRSRVLADVGEDGERGVSVYLPPGYQTSAASNPVLYVLHGAWGLGWADEWLFFGGSYKGNSTKYDIGASAKRLLQGGKIEPLIIVTADMNRHPPRQPLERFMPAAAAYLTGQNFVELPGTHLISTRHSQDPAQDPEVARAACRGA